MQDELTTARMVVQINEYKQQSEELKSAADRAITQCEQMATELAKASETLQLGEESIRKWRGKFMALARYVCRYHDDAFKNAVAAAYIEKSDIEYLNETGA